MLRENGYYCDRCGDFLAGEVTYGTDELDLCKECFEKEFVYCYGCHVVIRQEEAQYRKVPGEKEMQPCCSMCSNYFSQARRG